MPEVVYGREEAQDAMKQKNQDELSEKITEIKTTYRTASLCALSQLPPMFIVALAVKGNPGHMLAWTAFQAASFVVTAKAAELLDRRDARRRAAELQPHP